jgi:2-methylcitrate dehydratase PrpD
MGFSRTLAVWSSDLSFDDLPEAVVPWVKAAVLDFLAVSAAGSQADGVARRILSDERVEIIINIVNDLENLKNVSEVISMVSNQSEYAS